MNDGQIVALLNYLRSRFSNRPAWTGVDQVVENTRRTQMPPLRTAAGQGQSHVEPAQRDKP
jgi:hypothetical protein